MNAYNKCTKGMSAASGPRILFFSFFFVFLILLLIIIFK